MEIKFGVTLSWKDILDKEGHQMFKGEIKSWDKFTILRRPEYHPLFY